MTSSWRWWAVTAVSALMLQVLRVVDKAVYNDQLSIAWYVGLLVICIVSALISTWHMFHAKEY